MVCVAYVPEWEPLADALTRVMTSGFNEQQAKIDICNAVADHKIEVRIVIDSRHHPYGGETFHGENVAVPLRLDPNDLDWMHSRPLKPWSIGPVGPQRYTWISGLEECPISLIELSTADVQNVLCDAASTTTEAITMPRPDGSTSSKVPSNLPPRKRAKPVQYEIQKAVEALAKGYGGKFPPDDMPIKERDRIIVEWLRGDDDPVKPSKRTLRDYFSKHRK